jgi:hypothetical protein
MFVSSSSFFFGASKNKKMTMESMDVIVFF